MFSGKTVRAEILVLPAPENNPYFAGTAERENTVFLKARSERSLRFKAAFDLRTNHNSPAMLK